MKRFTELSIPTRILVVVGIVAFVSVGFAGGCSAYRRPPEFSASERLLLRAPPLPYSVTVSWWDAKTKMDMSPEAYATPLAKLVSRSGAFRTTRYQHSALPGQQDLVATSTGLYCNSAIIPILTIITLGIIPTIFQDEQCEGMLLRRSADEAPEDGVKVEIRSRQRVVMGWVAVVLGALPGWSYGSLGDDSRYAQQFHLAVIARSREIQQLVSARAAKP